MEERLPNRIKPELDLTIEEKAELLENTMLAQEVARERQEEQLEIYGKTDKQLEEDADAFLKAAGFDDLTERKGK